MVNAITQYAQVTMENKRPTISDPAEWAIVREMYFDTSRPLNDDTDPIEKWERMRSKQRNLNNNSR